MLDPCSRLFKKVNADFARRHIYIYSWNRLIKTTRSMDQPMEDRLEPSKYPIHACKFACIHTCLRACVHKYTHRSIRRCMHASIRPSIRHPFTHTHTYVGKYVHPYANSCVDWRIVFVDVAALVGCCFFAGSW